MEPEPAGSSVAASTSPVRLPPPCPGAVPAVMLCPQLLGGWVLVGIRSSSAVEFRQDLLLEGSWSPVCSLLWLSCLPSVYFGLYQLCRLFHTLAGSIQ